MQTPLEAIFCYISHALFIGVCYLLFMCLPIYAYKRRFKKPRIFVNKTSAFNLCENWENIQGICESLETFIRLLADLRILLLGIALKT